MVSILNVLDVIMVLELLRRRSLFLGDTQQCLWVFALSRSVLSDSLRSYGLQPTRLLCPWDFSTQSTGVECHCLLRYTQHSLTNLHTTYIHTPHVHPPIPLTHKGIPHPQSHHTHTSTPLRHMYSVAVFCYRH